MAQAVQHLAAMAAPQVAAPSAERPAGADDPVRPSHRPAESLLSEWAVSAGQEAAASQAGAMTCCPAGTVESAAQPEAKAVAQAVVQAAAQAEDEALLG